MHMTGSHEIFEDIQPGIKLDILEGARNPQFGDRVRLKRVDGPSTKMDGPGLRTIETVDTVRDR